MKRILTRLLIGIFSYSLLISQVFDPNTGALIKKDPKPSGKVDTVLTKRVQNIRFDPVTGEMIQSEKPINSKTMTSKKEEFKSSLFYSNDEVLSLSKTHAYLNHSNVLNIGIGLVGISGLYIGVPLTTIYVESELVTKADEMAISLNSKLTMQQQDLYIKTYIEEQRQLRRRTVYLTQGAIVLFIFLLL